MIGRGVMLPLLLTSALLVSLSQAHAQGKPARTRPATSQQTVPAPHWTSGKTSGTQAPASPRAAARPAACVHAVRSGESISRIAVRYRVSRAALIGANQLVNPHALRAGQRLTVPGCRPSVQAAAEAPVTPPPDGVLVKRVGPRRVLTALVLGEPDFQGEGITLLWPVGGPVISSFGQRSRGWHAGIDITAETGAEILAAAPGTVVYSGWIRSYGQVVKVEHLNGFITLYAHNEKNLVEVGEDVQAGQVIALVGRSGHATGPHVHFEVRRDGKAYDPLHLLAPSQESPTFEDDVIASSSEHDPHE